MKTKKKYQGGGDVGQPLRPSNFEKRQAKKVGRAQTRAVVANIEGEGTVAQKRDNRASRVSTMAGTARAKTPKSVSTSTSNSTSTVNNNNRPSGMSKASTESMKTTGKNASKPSVPAGKPKPEYKKTSVKTVPKDSVKSPVRYQNGGAISDIKSGAKQIASGVKKGAKTVVKATPEYQAYKAAGRAMKSVDDKLEKRYPNYTGKGSFYDGAKQAVKSVMGYQKGGPIQTTGAKGIVRPAQSAPKVTISPSSAPKKSTKKATPPRSTMDLIRGSKKSDYVGTVTQAAKKGGSVKKMQKGGQTSQAVAKKIVKGVKSDVKTAINTPYNVMKSVDDKLEKRYPNYTKPGGTYDMIKKGIKSVFKKGGAKKK